MRPARYGFLLAITTRRWESRLTAVGGHGKKRPMKGTR